MRDVVHVSTGDATMNLCLVKMIRVHNLISRRICILDVNIINRSAGIEHRLRLRDCSVKSIAISFVLL